MAKTKKFGIIGAGPSGLLMSLFLRYPNKIIEQSSTIGGHAGSFYDQGYTFDYGPHIMFSKKQQILNFMVKSLGGNVNKLKRNNKISYKNRLIKYPFENNLKSLPLQDNYECLYHFLFNPYKTKYQQPKNLEQWFLKTFGTGICEKYLIPYNEKIWNIPVDKLSMIWAQRIPNPPAEDIIKSAIGYETEGYLHQLYYYYPKRGGYGAISKAWAQKNKAPIHYNFKVKSITKLPDGSFRISDGQNNLVFNELISTMPIHELIKITNLKIPQNVISAIKNLIVNPMFIVSLGIKGIDKKKVTAIYFPEADFLVNRISYPATFSPNNAPKGHYSIQAEITCRKNSEIWKMSDQKIIDHTINGLVKRNLVIREAISYFNLTRSPYSYVVYDVNYEKNVKIVRNWFPRQGINLVGRFSYFEYINVDGAVATALQIASKINGKKMKLPNL